MRAVVVLCLVLTGCVSASNVGSRHVASDVASDEAAVIRTLHAACKAYLDADPARIRQLLTEDFTLTDPDGVITTREQDIENAKHGPIRYTVFENSQMKARMHGDAAVVTGITTVAGTASSTSFSSVFQFTDTVVRDGDGWRVASSHVSRIPKK